MTVSAPLFRVVRGDITRLRADVVVNAANRAMRGGGGVDGAIHRAGGPEILADCVRRFPDGLPTGGVGWTTAGDLPARYVVHAVGPNRAAGESDPSLLRSCYSGAIRTATDLGARSIAFPLISAGVYRWPLDDAIRIAIETILTTPGAVELVTLAVFDDAAHERATALLQGGLADRFVPFRILDAVAHLHAAGYHQVRCRPYVYDRALARRGRGGGPARGRCSGRALLVGRGTDVPRCAGRAVDQPARTRSSDAAPPRPGSRAGSRPPA
ncbi:macro domain-containing protein [Tsukamurella paurometabola]|uniref:O-acetyl-ADP-ribose deacetylase n=1 Tax=Tsukamurella paurometabola TaxID=2061 RepID=A0A3P8KUX8_TSUPA|nr:macro domain-containing protein [Tsukamurella paurometabola]VDR40927.1 O-acetyl-ADP-ribose deacetylase [Tsukamurella paurometabola]